MVLAAAVAALVGCGPQVSVSALNPAPRPWGARPVGSVEIYTTALPARPYVEVAALSAKGGQADQHVDAMREKAAELGCDALVFTGMARDTTASGYNWQSGAVQTASATTGSAATCVMWAPPPAAPAGPPGY